MIRTFVWSPVRFFDARLAQPPRWALAVCAPLLCVLLDIGAVHVLSGKIADALSGIVGVGNVSQASLQAARWSTLTTVAGYPACLAVSVLIMACLDVLHTDTGQQHRFVDLAGLAFAAFVPGCAFALVVALTWSSPPLPDPGFATAAEHAARYAASIRRDPWLSTSWVVYYFGLIWYTALLAAILKAAGALSARAAAFAAVALFVSLGGFRLLQFLPPLTR